MMVQNCKAEVFFKAKSYPVASLITRLDGKKGGKTDDNDDTYSIFDLITLHDLEKKI